MIVLTIVVVVIVVTVVVVVRSFETNFTTRDGVINVDVGSPGVTAVDDFRLEPGAAAAVAKLKLAGASVCVVTNQTCVGKGLVSEEDLDAIHERMRELLVEEGGPAAVVDDILVATLAAHVPCRRRKPSPGMLLEALESFGRGVYIGLVFHRLHICGFDGLYTRFCTSSKKKRKKSDPSDGCNNWAYARGADVRVDSYSCTTMYVWRIERDFITGLCPVSNRQTYTCWFLLNTTRQVARHLEWVNLNMTRHIECMTRHIEWVNLNMTRHFGRVNLNMTRQVECVNLNMTCRVTRHVAWVISRSPPLRSGVNASAATMVGDSVTDMQAAAAAGVADRVMAGAITCYYAGPLPICLD